MKQTAVEWLCEKYHLKQDVEIVKQAKEMEKQQIIDAHINGQSEYDKGAYRKEVEDNSEYYYNETFKK